MESTAKRLERKLMIQQKELKHEVTHTVVPDGWEPYELMQLLRWEDGAQDQK